MSSRRDLRKLCRVEREKDGKAQGVANPDPNGLRGGSVREIGRREQGECPACGKSRRSVYHLPSTAMSTVSSIAWTVLTLSRRCHDQRAKHHGNGMDIHMILTSATRPKRHTPTHRLEPAPDPPSDDPQPHPDDPLDRNDPTFPPAPFGDKPGVDDRRPQQLETVWPCGEGEYA